VPVMSLVEQGFCRSAPWQRFADRVVVPWALRGVELHGEVLEIGAGSGAMAAAVARRAPGASFTVTDLDPAMLRAAERRLARFGHVRVRQADVTALPFPDDSFDLVSSHLMLHHVVRWQEALAEAARVLRPGGRFVGYDLTRSVLARTIHVADRSPYHLLSVEDLDAGLDEAGFGTRRIERSLGGHLMRFTAQR
jgi:ubiquinone/menaquinone biosynthesis C-methylase UbiE